MTPIFFIKLVKFIITIFSRYNVNNNLKMMNYILIEIYKFLYTFLLVLLVGSLVIYLGNKMSAYLEKSLKNFRRKQLDEYVDYLQEKSRLQEEEYYRNRGY